MPASTRISLVRHGETDWNTIQRLQGHTDIPLNQHGLAQATQLAEAFASRELRFDALYSSDLQRAQQTATPLAQVLSLPLLTCATLRERHMGVLQGLTGVEAADLQPQHWHDFKHAVAGQDLGGGECPQTFCQRVTTAITTLAARHEGEHILIVTHGGVLDMAYRIATGMPLNSARTVRYPNAALNRLHICGQHWTIEQWADTSHLLQDARDEAATL